MNKSESISKISVALLKAQQSMGNAVKGASNPYFKSSFADLNSIREVVTPALNANGISVLQPTTFIDGRAFVETTLLHESGEFLSSLTEIVAAKQNDPQAAGSAISYSRRYGLQSFLSVGAVDDDGEASMGRSKPASSPQPKATPSETPVKASFQPTKKKESSFAGPKKKEAPETQASETPKQETSKAPASNNVAVGSWT